MKKIILTTFSISLILLVPKLQAQSSINASGGQALGGNGISSYSIGQVAYQNINNTEGAINEGVQQPIELFIITSSPELEIGISILAYPNPVQEQINLVISEVPNYALSYQLFDLQGRELDGHIITNAQKTIAVGYLESATYILRVLADNQPLKTFKIIKNN